MVLIGLKLLVVDDQADTLVMMRSLLESFGASVACTASVAEAVPLVRTWRPDIVICDVGMPDEDGYSLLRQIRALPEDEGGGTPAIACTGYVRVEERERALAAGFEMFVAKPVIASELVAAISAVREKKERESIG
jgi:CheY-like chemotaxis protein